jgi:hypothetical protein
VLVSSAELHRWIAEEIQKELLDEQSYDPEEIKAARAREYAEKAMAQRRASNLSPEAESFLRGINAAANKIDDDFKLAVTLRSLLLSPERVRQFAKLHPQERKAIWDKAASTLGGPDNIIAPAMIEDFEKNAKDIAAGTVQLGKNWTSDRIRAFAGGSGGEPLVKMPDLKSNAAAEKWRSGDFAGAVGEEFRAGRFDKLFDRYVEVYGPWKPGGYQQDGFIEKALKAIGLEYETQDRLQRVFGPKGWKQLQQVAVPDKNSEAAVDDEPGDPEREAGDPAGPPEPEAETDSEHRWSGAGGYPPEAEAETAPEEPEAETDSEHRWSGAGGYPPEAEPEETPEAEPEETPEADSAAIKVAKKLGRSRSVKEFFNTFLEAVTDSFDGNHKQQAAALKRLHSSRRILQDLSGEDKLAPDGEIDFNNAEVKELLDRYVYDFGLPPEAAQAYKKHFVTLVHNAEQRRRGEEEDAAYLANTGAAKDEKEGAPSQESPPAPETPRTATTAAPDKSEKPKMSRRERRRLDKLRHGAGAFEPLGAGFFGGRGSVPAQAIMDLDLEDAEDEEAIANYLRDKGYEITEANIKECQALLKEYRELKRWKELARIK